MNTLNKQNDLKGQHSFILLQFVYMWRTLPPFQLQTVSSFGELIFLWEQLVYSVIEKNIENTSEFLLLISKYVNIKVLSLNFFSKPP